MLENLTIFEGVQPGLLHKLEAEAPQQTYPAGTIIFTEGDAADGMHVMISGSVKIVKNVHGEQQQMAILGAGEFFGEMALVTASPRGATVLTAEGCVTLFISIELFNTIFGHEPNVSYRISQAIIHRMSANEKAELR